MYQKKKKKKKKKDTTDGHRCCMLHRVSQCGGQNPCNVETGDAISFVFPLRRLFLSEISAPFSIANMFRLPSYHYGLINNQKLDFLLSKSNHLSVIYILIMLTYTISFALIELDLKSIVVQ